MGSTAAYDVITEKIVELVETSGALPWQRPWNVTGADAPVSVRGHLYRGVNRLMLGLGSETFGYRDNRWITFKQAKESGGSVLKGEKSMPVVLWKPVEKDTKDEDGKPESFLVARYYRVFNLEQTEGTSYPEMPPIEVPSNRGNIIGHCEEIVRDMPKAPPITHGGPRAFYRPSTDNVQMPPVESFTSPQGYYGVLFHELSHSTGHTSRLGRKSLGQGAAPFGTADYSREELVAEMSSAFVCGAAGISTPDDTMRNAAYVQSWLKALKDDTKMIVQAAASASKAADWILGTTP